MTRPVTARRPSSSPRIWWVAGGAAVLVIVLLLVVLAVQGSGAKYEFATPPTAGGLQLDPSTATTMSTNDLGKAEAQSVVGGKGTKGVTGIYVDIANGGLKVTFSGVSGDLGSPDDLLARLRANPPTIVKRFNGTVEWTEVDPGEHGGKAACGKVQATLSGQLTTIITCSWQTETTFGQLTELPPSGATQVLSADDMASIMRRMRTDLEPTR